MDMEIHLKITITELLNQNRMTDSEFCSLYSSYYGEKIDQIGQLKQEVLSGEELKEIIEFFIKHYKSE